MLSYGLRKLVKRKVINLIYYRYIKAHAFAISRKSKKIKEIITYLFIHSRHYLPSLLIRFLRLYSIKLSIRFPLLL